MVERGVQDGANGWHSETGRRSWRYPQAYNLEACSGFSTSSFFFAFVFSAAISNYAVSLILFPFFTGYFQEYMRNSALNRIMFGTCPVPVSSNFRPT